MPLTDFNVGAGVKAKRPLLLTYVNVGDSSEEWEVLGRGVEDSSITFNPNSTTVTDILGFTETDVKSWGATQQFTPYTVRGGSKLALKLHEIWLNKTPELLSQFKVLIVYKYIGDSTEGFEAETQENCTISPDSLGGSTYVDMPITITFSNISTRGKVTYTGEKPTFEADSE